MSGGPPAGEDIRIEGRPGTDAEREAAWLSWVHPADRERIHAASPEQVVACRTHVLKLLLDTSLDWTHAAPLLPQVVATLFAGKGEEDWRAPSAAAMRALHGVIPLALRLDSERWEAFRDAVERAPSMAWVEDALRRLPSGPGRDTKRRGVQMDRLREDLMALCRRFSPWHDSLVLRFSEAPWPLGQTDGLEIVLSKRIREFEDDDCNRIFGMGVLLHELVHVDLDRSATVEPRTEEALLAWATRELAARDRPLPDSAPRDALATLTGAAESPDGNSPSTLAELLAAARHPRLYRMLVNLLEDIAVNARVDAYADGFAWLRQDFLIRRRAMGIPPVLLDRRGRLLAALQEEAVGTRRPDDFDLPMLDAWEPARALIRELRARPEATRPQLLLLGTRLYDLLVDELGDWYGAPAAEPFSLAWPSLRTSPVADGAAQSGAPPVEDRAAMEAQRARLEASIETGEMPTAYTSLPELGTKPPRKTRPSERYPEWNAWERSAEPDAVRVVSERTLAHLQQRHSAGRRASTGARLDLREAVRLHCALRASHQPVLAAPFVGTALRRRPLREVHVLLDLSTSMRHADAQEAAPRERALRLIDVLCTRAQDAALPVAVHGGRDQGRWSVERLLLKDFGEAWTPLSLASRNAAGVQGCRTGALLRSILRERGELAEQMHFVVLTDAGSRYVAHNRCRIIRAGLRPGCGCLRDRRCPSEPVWADPAYSPEHDVATFLPEAYEAADVAHAITSRPGIRLTWACLASDFRTDPWLPHLGADALVHEPSDARLAQVVCARVLGRHT